MGQQDFVSIRKPQLAGRLMGARPMSLTYLEANDVSRARTLSYRGANKVSWSRTLAHLGANDFGPRPDRAVLAGRPLAARPAPGRLPATKKWRRAAGKTKKWR